MHSYEAASALAKQMLAPTDVQRLVVALNFSTFLGEVVQRDADACAVAAECAPSPPLLLVRAKGGGEPVKPRTPRHNVPARVKFRATRLVLGEVVLGL